MFVYKILTSQEWEMAKLQDLYEGTTLDQKDGFIHLSTKEQLVDTLALYFHNQAQLSLLSFLAADLENLKWEKSRDNQDFPHLYAKLPILKCQELYSLSLGTNGVPQLPWDKTN